MKIPGQLSVKINNVDVNIVNPDRFGTELSTVQWTARCHEIKSMLFLPDSLAAEDRRIIIQNAVDEFEQLRPADGLERMLAVQMVGAHQTILECLRRANLGNQTNEGRDINLKNALKLMELYLKQITALNKHRGKGQQKVVVEHVNVAPGGQANVGNVELAQQQTNLTEKDVSKNIIDLETSDDDWLDAPTE